MTRPLRFGLLTVRGHYRDSSTRHTICICRCRCGQTTHQRRVDLLAGSITSCGCGRVKHGGYLSPTWQTWSAMRRRCSDPKFQSYPNYGGRGIAVCARWNDVRTGFAAFRSDVGERPDGMTIDRKDNHANYSCGHCPDCVARGWIANCRWATVWDQAANKRRYVRYFWQLEMAGSSEGSEREHWHEMESKWMAYEGGHAALANAMGQEATQ